MPNVILTGKNYYDVYFPFLGMEHYFPENFLNAVFFLWPAADKKTGNICFFAQHLTINSITLTFKNISRD